MHPIHGLLWEQWRQTRYWVIGTCAFPLMLTSAVARYRPWILAQFYDDTFPLGAFAWVIGFTLLGMLFVNQRMRDISLVFPGRLFTLPCGTMPLVASQLLYKSAVAILLGGLISVYQWLLLDQEGPSALAIYLYLALVAVVQALVLFARVAGAWPTLGASAVGAFLVVALFDFLESDWGFAWDEAAPFVSLAAVAAGWCVALACGPTARHGVRKEREARLSFENGTISLRLVQPVTFRKNFTSPAWAHAWYEWRRVCVWPLRAVLPVTTLLTLYALSGGDEDMALLSLYAFGLAAASACGYFLFRVTPAERRFFLAQPGGEAALVNGKLIAALLSSLSTAAMAALVLTTLSVSAIFFGQGGMGREILHFLPVFSITLAGLLWIALTSAPTYLIVMVSTSTAGLLFVTPMSLVVTLGVNEFVVGVIASAVAVSLAFLAWRRLRARGIPIPWELSLALLAFGPAWLSMMLPYYHLDSPFSLRQDEQVGVLLPLFSLFGGLLFARRIGIISGTRAAAALTGYALASVLFLSMYALNFRQGPLTELDTIFYFVAACFAPVIWMPLAVRLQRYR